MERGFDFACDYFVYRDVAFSHAPLTPLPTQTLVSDGRTVNWNVHGHFHKGKAAEKTKTPKVYEDKYYDSTYYMQHRERYILVQIEDGLTPVQMDAVLKTGKVA